MSQLVTIFGTLDKVAWLEETWTGIYIIVMYPRLSWFPRFCNQYQRQAFFFLRPIATWNWRHLTASFHISVVKVLEVSKNYGIFMDENFEEFYNSSMLFALLATFPSPLLAGNNLFCISTMQNSDPPPKLNLIISSSSTSLTGAVLHELTPVV